LDGKRPTSHLGASVKQYDRCNHWKKDDLRALIKSSKKSSKMWRGPDSGWKLPGEANDQPREANTPLLDSRGIMFAYVN
jgi:hypothetical protein